MSQPLFSLLGANPEFLIVRGSTRLELILFAAALVVAVPLGAVFCEWALHWLSRRGSDVLHVLFLGAFTLPIALHFLKRFDPGQASAVVAAVTLAVAAVAAYVRWRPVRMFLTASIALPVVGFAVFVSGIPVVADDASAAELPSRPSVPVVLVVFDELPVSSLMTADGDLDGVRYPNFARLARSATWYPRATTVHNHTTGAVPAILSGRLPHTGQLPTLSGHPHNLFTLLGGAYHFDAHEVLTYLCPQRYCPRDRAPVLERIRELASDLRVAYLHRVLPQSLSAELPAIGDRWTGLARERVRAMRKVEVTDVFADASEADTREFEAFLSGFTPNESPATLHFAHILLPHNPWRWLPSGRMYEAPYETDGVRPESGFWVEDPWPVRQGFQRHLLQVGYTDRVLGRVLDRLRRQGLYDRALVIVVADHGVSFIPAQPRRAANATNLADIARVPLLVKLPGQKEGHVDLRPARTVDVLPTIADVLDVRLPWVVDGRSLLRRRHAVRDVAVLHHDGHVVRFPVPVVDRGQAATLRRKAAFFGEGPESLYRIGTNVSLLGASVASRAKVWKAVRAHLDDEAQFDHVRPASSVVPVRVTGTLDGAAIEPSPELAIAVNGRVAALTRWFLKDGVRQFSAVVPEQALRSGRNRVDVYAVVVEDDRIELVRIERG